MTKVIDCRIIKMSEIGANKTIAKNTIFLYIRSFLMMGINLYASRVILEVLGVEDYGLYGAIGSFVAMFTIINGVLSAGTSRFLTFELGRKDYDRLKKTFSASFALHVCLAILLFVLLETLGLWFVNNKMSIPEGRVFAANVVFQLSIITCMISLVQVPYNATIIAHERMSVYAYIGVVEAIFKLALIFVLLYAPFSDKLITYAIILILWAICLLIWYVLYCRKRFSECHIQLVKDKSIYKGMLSYSLWDFVGQFCATGNSQGINILINMFFGVTMNAARSISYQVENAIMQFSNNFMTSLQPQIVKSFAQKDYDRFFILIYEGGKYSFYLLFMVSLPIFLEADYILSIWLLEVPPLTSLFLRCIMVITLVRVPIQTLIKGVHATGNVKTLNLTAGVYSALTFLPFVYIFYKVGLPVWTCFIIQAFNGWIVCSYFEMRALKKQMDYSMWDYYKKVVLLPIAVCVIPSIVAALPSVYMEQCFLRLLITGSISVITTSICVYFFGITKNVRAMVNCFIKSKFLK